MHHYFAIILISNNLILKSSKKTSMQIRHQLFSVLKLVFINSFNKLFIQPSDIDLIPGFWGQWCTWRRNVWVNYVGTGDYYLIKLQRPTTHSDLRIGFAKIHKTNCSRRAKTAKKAETKFKPTWDGKIS